MARQTDDADILNALMGIKFGQQQLRNTEMTARGNLLMWCAYLAGHYRSLPGGVARRLTELRPEALAELTSASALRGPELAERIGRIAGEAAFAQVIRAANVYRARLGSPLLGPDGWPEQD